MRRREAAGVGHVFAGPELKHLHEAQRHAPLQKELLVKCYASAATAAAILKSEKETSDENALIWNPPILTQVCNFVGCGLPHRMLGVAHMSTSLSRNRRRSLVLMISPRSL